MHVECFEEYCWTKNGDFLHILKFFHTSFITAALITDFGIRYIEHARRKRIIRNKYFNRVLPTVLTALCVPSSLKLSTLIYTLFRIMSDRSCEQKKKWKKIEQKIREIKVAGIIGLR